MQVETAEIVHYEVWNDVEHYVSYGSANTKYNERLVNITFYHECFVGIFLYSKLEVYLFNDTFSIDSKGYFTNIIPYIG